MAITLDGSDNKIAIGANATGSAYLRLYEDTDNGTNYVDIIAPASVTSNRTLTLPDATGTVVVTGGAQTIEFAAGSASTPSITTTGDTNTGIFFPAADTIAFGEGGAEVARFDSSGNFGVGVTAGAPATGELLVVANKAIRWMNASSGTEYGDIYTDTSNNMVFRNGSGATERARITSSGDFWVGTTNGSSANGVTLSRLGSAYLRRDSDNPLTLDRITNDGILVELRQDTTNEGTISVSGTTVSYNGGHLSRWAQMPGTKDDTLVKGTVMSNLDEMNVYTDAEGNPVDNEQLNKVKVSDVEGDINVAGVFVNWTYDDAHQVDEINMAMTGDMIIRIAQGVVVQKGDLLMSAGDGTAKPQGDDIVRSKTVAKVTSNHVTCTYADGSYCVPCVLMAC